MAKRSQAARTLEEQNASGKNNPSPARTLEEQNASGKNNPAARGTSKDRKRAAIKDSDPLMYVGPTVTGFAIQNRVYSEIPAEAKEKFTDSPQLRNLFIPIREYPKANRMIREGTGYIYSAFLSALDLRR